MLKGRIYCVTCLLNGKMYFGQTVHSVKRRMVGHIYSAQRGSDHKFHRAIRKYGEENFLVEEVLTVSAPTKKELKAKLDFIEMRLIRKFDSKRNGYNSTWGGEGALGAERSEGTKQKISRLHKGKKLSEEHRRKLSISLRGNKNSLGNVPSLETRNKLREIGLHRKHSEETKRKISLSRIGEKNPFYGKKMSSESKRKMLDSKGIPPIVQFSLKGEVIKVFSNIEDIKKELFVSKKCVRKHIRNGTSYKGFIWNYQNGK